MDGDEALHADYTALVVGIDYGGGIGSLSTIADAKAVRRVLEHDAEVGGPIWDVTVLAATVDGTEQQVKAAVRTLVHEAGGQHLLFYFSGHGAVPDDELVLLTKGGGEIPIDWVMKRFNGCGAATVTVILDCCFSGAAGDEARVWSSGRDSGQRVTVLRENLALMTASQRDQTARSGDQLSPFTRLLVSGLGGGAADHQGSVSIVDLFSYVSGYFLPDEQRPQLKINMTDVPFVLKRDKPRVSEEVLGKLTTWFKEPRDWKRLTPEHEGDRPGWPPEKGLTDLQKEFDEIGRVRNLGMIESERSHDGHGEPHYWVAMNRQRIRLSPIGQWYWAKVKRRQQAAQGSAE